MIAVVAIIVISTLTDAAAHGVTVVGTVQGGFPPIGLPQGMTWSDVPKVVGVAFSCFVLIIAQSAATSRSFAMKHGQRVGHQPRHRRSRRRQPRRRSERRRSS